MKLNHFKKQSLYAGLVLMLSSLSASAMGLMEAYEAALIHDSVYRAAKHDNQAGQEYKVIGRSNLLPQISASYSVNENDSDVQSSNNGFRFDEERDYKSTNGIVQLRQPIVNLESWARYKQGNLQTELSNRQFQEQKQVLIQRLFSLYVQANYAEDVRALAQSERDAFELQAKANEMLAKKGAGTKTALLEAQARYNLAEAQLVEANNTVANSKNALAQMVGSQVDALNGLEDTFKAKPVAPSGFADWKQMALDNNLAIAIQKENVALAYQELKRNKATRIPTLDAVASISKTESDTVATFNQEIDNRSIGLQLNIPIYSGGQTGASIRQAQANYQKAKDELESKTNEVLLDLREQYNTVTSSLYKITALQQSVESATLLIDATQKSKIGGIRTNLDVLDARKQLFEAKRVLSETRYAYLQAYVNLKKAAGTLAQADLENIAKYFTKTQQIKQMTAESLKIPDIPIKPIRLGQDSRQIGIQHQ